MRAALRAAAQLAILALLAGAWPVAATTVAEHPDFTEDVQRPARIVLLPPEANIVRGKVTEAEPMIKETRALEEGLTWHGARMLEQLGYRIDSSSLSPEALLADRELQAMTELARSRALEVLGQAARDPKGISRGRFSIGDTGLPLLGRTGATGLLLLRSDSYIVSKGNKAIAGFFNPFNLLGATRTRTQLLAALYDLRDGQLLAVAIGGDVGAVLKKPEQVAQEVSESAFRDFPRRGAGRSAKRKWRQAAPQRDLQTVAVGPAGTAMSGAGDEEILAAFEAAAARHEDTPAEATDAVPSAGATDAVPSAGAGAVPRAGATDAVPRAGAGVEAGAAPDRAESLEADPLAGSRSEQPKTIRVGESPRVELRAPGPAVAAAIARMLQAPPDRRPAPELGVVFLGDEGWPPLLVSHRARRPLRLSVDGSDWVRLEPGGELSLVLAPGSHRLLVADSKEDRELARAACVVRAGRSAVVEIVER